MLFNKPWFYNRTFIEENAKNIAGNVIDIGCASSKYKNEILKINKVRSYTGLDLIKNPAVDIVADLNGKLPIKNNTFDTAICISVLEHLLEPANALKEISRILKPGSFLLISAPWIYPYHLVPNDYYRYSSEALTYLLEKAGFSVVALTSSGGRARVVFVFLTKWFTLLNKFIPLIDHLFPKSNNDKDTPDHHVVARKN